MTYRGDIRLEDTVDLKFTTRRFTTGAPFALASGVISAYVGNSTTQITAGITLTADFDGVTGLNNVRVVATAANGYAAATNVDLVITTGTVDSVSVVGEVIGSFSIENRSALRPTAVGRTLDVSAGGEAGIDWANVGTPGSTVVLSATTVATVSTATATTTVNGLGANVITAASIAADAITAAKIADGAIDAATFAAGAINAAAIAADAITDAKVAADVTIASVTGAVGSVTGNVGGSVASVASGGIAAASFAAGAIDAAAIANGAIDAATFAAGAIDAAAIATDAFGALELAAGAASEIATAVRSELTTELGRIDAATSTRASQASVDAVDDFVDTEVAAIKAVTDKLDTALVLDGSVYQYTANALELAPTGGGTADWTADERIAIRTILGIPASGTTPDVPSAGPLKVIDDFLDTEVVAIKAKTDNLPVAPAAVGDIPTAALVADAVWDEAMAGHLAAGSTGNALNNATAAGNPWAAVIEGALTAQDLLRVLAGVAAGKTNIVDQGGGAALVTFRDITDASDIVEAQMQGSERQSVAVTP